MANYTTIEDIKSRLSITVTNYDTVLASHAETASRWIDRFCNQPDDSFVVSTATTRYFDQRAIDDYRLRLDMPLLSVTTLVNGDGNTLTSIAYRLQPRNEPRKWWFEILTGYQWSFVNDNEIAVTGLWGYSQTVPAPVKEACAWLGSWIFKRYQAALQDNSANSEFGQIIYGEEMPRQVKALLEPYRNKGSIL